MPVFHEIGFLSLECDGRRLERLLRLLRGRCVRGLDVRGGAAEIERRAQEMIPVDDSSEIADPVRRRRDDVRFQYALSSAAPYHMPHATTTRKSTQAHVGIGAGVSARIGSKASPGRLANALTSREMRPLTVSPSARPTTAMPGPLRTVNGISRRRPCRNRRWRRRADSAGRRTVTRFRSRATDPGRSEHAVDRCRRSVSRLPGATVLDSSPHDRG
jgi:hypothetical protein